MSYPYTAANRIAEPANYMYSAFEGLPFLHEYLSVRREAVLRYPGEAGAHPAFDVSAAAAAEEALAGRGPSRDGANFEEAAASLTQWRIDGAVVTAELLAALTAAELSLNGGHDAMKFWTDRLIQRFEVTKKLYQRYPPGFRKGEGAAAPRLYWLLALVLCLHYRRTRRLKVLNALLKVNDLLCSLEAGELRAAGPQGGVRLVLETECGFVAALAREKGVAIAAD